MCCNGVLFQVVRLQPGDSVRELSALGMQLRRKKKEPYFTQPCAFLTPDCTCTIYAARPTRCRQFQCQLLLSLAAEQTTESEAMLTVEKAKTQVAAVTALLPEADPSLALTEQVQQAAAAQAPQLEALWMAMEQLQSLLASEFLPTAQQRSIATQPVAQQDGQ
jgi:Fe-S-cluster containining protein